MEENINIKKQIQTEKFIIHTDEIIPFPLERMWKVYPKVETKGYIKIPFDLKLTEQNYTKCVLDHFKIVLLSSQMVNKKERYKFYDKDFKEIPTEEEDKCKTAYRIDFKKKEVKITNYPVGVYVTFEQIKELNQMRFEK